MELKKSKGSNKMDKNSHEISSIEFPDFSGNHNLKQKVYIPDEIAKLADLRITVTAQLGIKEATVGEIENYKIGDVLEVERTPGHMVDIYVGDEKIAVGEIIPMEDKFALVISEVLSINGEFLKNVRKNGEVE